MRSSRPVRMWLVRALVLTLGLIVIPYTCSRLLSPWRRLSLHSTPDAAAPVRQAGGVLRLATYNIAHGRGDGPSTRNWTGESRAQRLQRLDEIAALLRTVDADVVVLNEVDFDSSWSRGINQARELAQRAGYAYWVEERNLDFRLLFWTWRFGNAVLSKYPITTAQVVNLPAYSALETVVAGKKRGVVCDIELEGTPVRVAGVHLCHRSEPVRAASAELLARMAADSPAPFFVIGDLNSTPPDFREPAQASQALNAIQVFDASRRFQRTPTRRPTEAEMTFHSARPTAVIDWILIPGGWEFGDYAVVPSNLSDHRLVRADVHAADKSTVRGTGERPLPAGVRSE